MKTLIIKYLPTGENSKTKKLLDLFLQEAAGQKIETVDLLKEKMPLFDENSIQAYYKRNYGGQKLNESEAKLLEQNDKLVAQLKSADVIVMAYPMHNFGMPAAVKAYLDAVVMKGETFDYGQKMMAGKKVLTLFTSGGIYSENTFNFDYPNWNSIALMTKANFSFMGFDESEIIGTSLRDEATESERLNEANSKISTIVKKWYN
jgi:FMN-dependent NADH-azoreductase